MPNVRIVKSFAVLFCCPDAGEENSDQLFGFSENRCQPFLGEHLRFLNQTEPSPGFFQLFQANLQFMNKVFPRFGGFYLAVIAIRRSAAAEKLRGNMITRPRIRKRINQSNNPRAELKQSIF